jgi:hypothetical protein
MIETLQVRTCDMTHDKSRTGETIQFGFAGIDYEVELCPKDKRVFDSAVKEFLPHARKVRPENTTKQSRPKDSRPKVSRDHSGDVRAWARANGIQVNDKGRIPVKVIEQYATREI